MNPEAYAPSRPTQLLDEAYGIVQVLMQKSAALFTAGELLWLAADQPRARFATEVQAERFLHDCRQLQKDVARRARLVMDGEAWSYDL